MKRLLLALAGLAWAGTASAQVAVVQGARHGLLTGKGYAALTADLTTPGATIPASFVGYSINPTSLVNGGLLTPSNTSLVNLAKMLGPNGVLRIGGSDGDLATPPALTQTIANNLAAFTQALGSGWTLIYGLDARANDSATAASQAQMIATAVGDLSKVEFQFGNEALDGSSPMYTPSAYVTVWNNYFSAVRAAVPGAKIACCDSSMLNLYPQVVPNLTGGLATLSEVTQHWYPFTRPATVTPSLLVSSPLANSRNEPASSELFQNQQYANTTPMRVTETNSVANGGQIGNSDTLQAATWYLNEAMLFAQMGYVGLNTHINLWDNHSPYSSPIVGAVPPNAYGPLLGDGVGNYYPGTEFYGLYLFSRIEGQQLLPLTSFGNANLAAVATKAADGSASFLVANNDVSRPAVIVPDLTVAWTTGTVLTLSGTSCSDTAPTLGGQPITAGGAWSGTTTSVSYGGGVTIPACGAVLVQIQPSPAGANPSLDFSQPTNSQYAPFAAGI